MCEVVETNFGKFKLIKNYKEAFELFTFNERYVDYLDRYRYIVGDYSGDLLRLKGFTEENYETIPDYLIESCTPKAPYFVLLKVVSETTHNKVISTNNKQRKQIKRKNH